jgi:hypothetical protein
MAIDFKSTLNSRNQVQTTTAKTERKPTAQFWLNFGYMVASTTEGEDSRFVSLPMGIPLDTMDKVSVRSQNQDYAQFQAARNDLLDQMLEAAGALQPGQDYVLEVEGGLAVQIRRVAAEVEAPKTDESNVYARPKLFNIAA